MQRDHFVTLEYVYLQTAELSGIGYDELRHGKNGNQATNLWRMTAIYTAHEILYVPIRSIAMYTGRSLSGVGQLAKLMYHAVRDRGSSDPFHRTHREPADALFAKLMPDDPDGLFMPPEKPLKPGTDQVDT